MGNEGEFYSAVAWGEAKRERLEDEVRGGGDGTGVINGNTEERDA